MGGLSALIDDFVNGRGRFKEIQISRRQMRGYKKSKIVPVAFIAFLKEQGLSDVAETFLTLNRYARTVSALEAYIEGQAPNFAFLAATGRMLGNLRYQICDCRASPESILITMLDQ